MDECIEMARIAYNEGIRTIVATPHVIEGVPSANKISALVNDLNSALQEQNIGIRALPGAEVQAHAGITSASAYTINRSRYILLEFQHNFISMSSTALLFTYRSMGFTPVLSHAERSPSVINDPSSLSMLIDMGCLVQITAASVTGDFGQEIKACAIHLLCSGMVNVLATDAHSVKWRPPLISEALRECERYIGAKATSSLVLDAPRMIISEATGDS